MTLGDRQCVTSTVIDNALTMAQLPQTSTQPVGAREDCVCEISTHPCVNRFQYTVIPGMSQHSSNLLRKIEIV